MKISHTRRALIATASLMVLSGCGADDIASTGSGGNVTITYPAAPAPTPAPSTSPTPTATLVTPAAGCPTIADPQGLTDGGTITTPGVGEFRVCVLPKIIQRSATLTKVPGLVYQLNGRTDVGCDRGPDESSVPAKCFDNTTTTPAAVTLTINPGVVIYANTGVSWLAVNRGNKIQAVGSASQPIIMTSRDNMLGLNSDSSSGQWGGLVLLGRARITDCAVSGAQPGTNACYRQTEGASDPSYYGGTTDTDNSGHVSYMQIRYSGYVLSMDSELQSLTAEGVGSATQIDHIMSFNSSDDGSEFFGGTVNENYYLSVGAEDDNLDTDTGLQGHFQFVAAIQRDGIGDSFIEDDSDNAFNENLPRQHTIVANATFVGSSTASSTNADLAAILLRGDSDYTLANSVVYTPTLPCLRISQAQTASTSANPSIDELGAPVFRSVALQCGGSSKYLGANGVTADQVQAIFGAGSNNNTDTFTNSLVAGMGGGRAYINGASENGVTAYNATAFNSVQGSALYPNANSTANLFVATSYIGAFNGTENWAQGWTCNSVTAYFGTGNSGLCTSIPST